MARLTIEVDGQLLDDMTALAKVECRGTEEMVHTAIAEYLREHGMPHSTARTKAATLAERKRLSERTGGMWKDREIDGLQYQLEQRAEW
jgi:predicted transcriptional regulator